MLYFHFLLVGSIALRAATEKTLNRGLISCKHYFNLLSFIFTAPKKTQNKTLHGIPARRTVFPKSTSMAGSDP
jgi:hypothetical protein